MEITNQALRERLADLLFEWNSGGKPTRTGFQSSAKEIILWKKKNNVSGLWEIPPLLATATIDDGWGHGLELIHLWSKVVGLKVQFLGLLLTPKEIIRRCLQLQPDFLGMTVLQFDTEDALISITGNLPPKTRLIAGGPLFGPDPELAERTGIHFVAKNAADFLSFMLNYEPDK